MDPLSNAFSIYFSIQRHWCDSRLQIQWKENETVKYLPSDAAEKFWFPWLDNYQNLEAEMSERELTLNRLVTILLFLYLESRLAKFDFLLFANKFS